MGNKFELYVKNQLNWSVQVDNFVSDTKHFGKK